MTDEKAQVMEALAAVKAPTDYDEWFGWLPPMKAAGVTAEEAQAWSRVGGVNEKWVVRVPEKWAVGGMRDLDHGMAVNIIFKKAREEAGWQGGPARSGRGAPTPPDLVRLARKPTSYHGTVREGAYTVSDLMNEPIWFVQGDKHPYQDRIPGGFAGYRQSLAEKRGGIVKSRYGGEIVWHDPNGVAHRFLVYPHRNHPDIMAMIPKLPNRHRARLAPSISLAGNAEYKHPTDLVVVDFDYKPEEDETGEGAAFRDRTKAAALDRGAPVYKSSSGNGFHAIFRMPPDWVRTSMKRGTERRMPKNRKETVSGAVAEIFPAGYRKHVVLKLGNGAGNNRPDCEIPYISEAELWRMLVTMSKPVETSAKQGPQNPQEADYWTAPEPDQERQDAPWDPFGDAQNGPQTTCSGKKQPRTGCDQGRDRPGSCDQGRDRPGSCDQGRDRPGSCDQGRDRPGSCDQGRDRPGSCDQGRDRPGSCDQGRDRPGSCDQGRDRPGSCGSSRRAGRVGAHPGPDRTGG